MAAYLDRTDLCAHGFYSTPDVTGFGGLYPFNYLCYGERHRAPLRLLRLLRLLLLQAQMAIRCLLLPLLPLLVRLLLPLPPLRLLPSPLYCHFHCHHHTPLAPPRPKRPPATSLQAPPSARWSWTL